MKQSNKIYILGGVILVFIVLIYFFGQSRSAKNSSDDWTESYKPAEISPFGTYIMKELIDTVGLFGNFIELDQELSDVLVDNPDENDIYFFIGKTNFLSEASTTYLLDFVDAGNVAFMAAESFPTEFLDEICYDRNWIFRDSVVADTIQYFKFHHPDLAAKRYAFKSIKQNKVSERLWFYFNEFAFDNEHLKSVQSIGSSTTDQWNFVHIKYGNGHIFLHSNPYLFTNISMTKREGFQYAENVLKHLPPGRIQWDRYNLEWHNDNNDDDGGDERRSVLEFIMQHPPLYWALFLLLIGALLYIVFKGKRTQPLVPAIDVKENTSLQYIESHVDPALIREIFKQFERLEKEKNVTDDALILLHKKIEQFHKTCR